MIIQIVFVISCILLYWQFVGYPVYMLLIAKGHKETKTKAESLPKITIVIPCYEEKTVIRTRLDNLITIDYPKELYNIVVVDSGSNDGTREIVADFILNHNGTPSVSLLNQKERRGKANALNEVLSTSKTDIVVISDANTVYDPAAVRNLVSHFSDEKVGVVTGRYCVSNQESGLASEEGIYWKIENIMYQGESTLDSSCSVVGTISAWRGNLLHFNEDIISEDLDMAIRIRQMGYRIVYEPKAIAYEKAANSHHDQVIQRKRTAKGTIQCLFKNKRYLMLPRDKYTAIIFPSHRGLQVLSPFVLTMAIISMLLSFPQVIGALLLGLLTFAVVFSTVGMLIEPSVNNPKLRSFLRRIGVIHYLMFNLYIILGAWLSFLSRNRKGNVWQKADSTR